MLSIRRLRWLGHAKMTEDGNIPKDRIYGELQMVKRSWGRPLLRHRYMCKRGMQDTNIDLVAWEQDAFDRVAWRGKIINWSSCEKR
jgi:hypothetical protein